MRSIEDQMAEIRRRSSLYREKRQIRTLSLISAGIGFLLMAVLVIAPGVNGIVAQSSSVLGSMILGPVAGGYVIVSILAFALGVIVILIIQKSRDVKDI
jgi:hypothetical protein